MNEVEPVGLAPFEVSDIVDEIKKAGYKFVRVGSVQYEVGLVLPSGERIDYTSYGAAVKAAVRRMYWRTAIADKAIAAQKAQNELNDRINSVGNS